MTTELLPREIEHARREGLPAHDWIHRLRARLDNHPRLRVLYRALVGIVGTLTIIIGLILVPLPGPGWLIVFGGFALLGTEFRGARRVSQLLRRVLARAWAWLRARREARDARRATAT